MDSMWYDFRNMFVHSVRKDYGEIRNNRNME